MDAKDIVDIFSKSVTAIATILAGGWAFFRFVKGRVFKPRLTLTVSARQLCTEGTAYLLSTIQLTNVGLSRVDIAGATLRVCSLSGEPDAELVATPELAWLETPRVLLAHSWIESGEALREENILILPLNHRLPVHVDCKVLSRGLSFTATAIAIPSDKVAENEVKRDSL